MTLKDLLKKKDKIEVESSQQDDALQPPEGVPQFTFLRTTSTSQEVIEPPIYPGDAAPQEHHKRLSRFRRHTNAASTTPPERHRSVSTGLEAKPELGRRLSERLHLARPSRSASTSSVNIPESLPKEPEGGAAKGEEEEAQWEKRATLLAKSNPNIPGEGGNTAVGLSDATGDVWNVLWFGKSCDDCRADFGCACRRIYRRLLGYMKRAVSLLHAHGRMFCSRPLC
jgi:hypothetical protein